MMPGGGGGLKCRLAWEGRVFHGSQVFSPFLTLSVPCTWVRLDPEDPSHVSWVEMTSPKLKESWEGPKLFSPSANQPVV